MTEHSLSVIWDHFDDDYQPIRQARHGHWYYEEPDEDRNGYPDFFWEIPAVVDKKNDVDDHVQRKKYPFPVFEILRGFFNENSRRKHQGKGGKW